MNAFIAIVISLLSNKRVIDFIIGLLEKLADKPDNAVNEEYVNAQQRSLSLRIDDNQLPENDNIFLGNDELRQIKNHRTRKPT